MKKVFRSFAALAVSVLTLTSCLSKTTFAEFQTAAKEAANKEANYTKVSFSGKIKSSGMTIEMDGVGFELKDDKWTATDKTEAVNGAVGLVLIATTVWTVAVTENTSYNYYIGGGFKVENAENTKEYDEWNEYGYLIATSDGTNTLKASWSK